jgi:hypothetical protein
MVIYTQLPHGYSDRIIRQQAGAKNHDTTATINVKTSHGMVPNKSCVGEIQA